MRTGSKQATEIKRLTAGDLGSLAVLVNHLSCSHFPGDAVLTGAYPVIRSPHHLGEASAMAQILIGIGGLQSGMRACLACITLCFDTHLRYNR